MLECFTMFFPTISLSIFFLLAFLPHLNHARVSYKYIVAVQLFPGIHLLWAIAYCICMNQSIDPSSYSAFVWGIWRIWKIWKICMSVIAASNIVSNNKLFIAQLFRSYLMAHMCTYTLLDQCTPCGLVYYSVKTEATARTKSM